MSSETEPTKKVHAEEGSFEVPVSEKLRLDETSHHMQRQGISGWERVKIFTKALGVWIDIFGPDIGFGEARQKVTTEEATMTPKRLATFIQILDQMKTLLGSDRPLSVSREQLRAFQKSVQEALDAVQAAKSRAK